MKKPLVAFAFLLALFAFLPTHAGAVVSIEPSSKSLSVFSDTYFDFNVTISGASDVYGVQFDLIYNPNVFESPNVSKGTFLNRNGQDPDYYIIPNTSTAGLINDFAWSRLGISSVSGAGLIAKITLKLKPIVSFPSTSDITLSQVKISDIDSQHLDNSTINGIAKVYECLQGEGRSCIADGQVGSRVCDSSNQWSGCQISPPNSPGGGGDYTPPQNTTNATKEDKNETKESLQKADMNNDNCVNIQDLAFIGMMFGQASGSDSMADLNGDREVDIYDLVLAALEFGKGSGC